VVLGNAELSEEPDNGVELVSGHFMRDPYLMQSTTRVVHGLAPPRPDPVINAIVLPKNHVTNGGARERPETNARDGSAITDLCYQARKIISREIHPGTNEVRPGILLACLRKRGTRKVQQAEVREHTRHGDVGPEHPRFWKQESGEIRGVLRPGDLDGLDDPVTVNLERERRGAFVLPTRLHREDVPDVRQ